MGKLKRKLLNAEYLSNKDNNMLFDYIYIIQDRKKHESGYNIMHIVGSVIDVAEKSKKYYKLSDVSDVVDFGKIFDDKYIKFSFDIPEYNVIRLFPFCFNETKFRAAYLHCSSFKLDVVNVEEE